MSRRLIALLAPALLALAACAPATRVVLLPQEGVPTAAVTVQARQGQVVLDVSGEERSRMDVPDLLQMFEKVRGEKLSDDALLLS